MNGLKADQIKAAKGKGFLRNRGTECFSGRVVSAGGVYTAQQLARIAQCAEQYGNGTVAFTSRLSAEIVGIPFEKIEDACAYLEESALYFGGTGAKIRPITACKGTTCVFGCFDTQAFAQQLHEAYYIGWEGTPLPHKFKIGVGGCPNSCMKPSLNDFGIEARRSGKEVRFQVYVGGTWGKVTRIGTPLSQTMNQDEIIPLLDKVLAWYQKYGESRERFGACIDRIGINMLEAEIGIG